MIETVTVLGQRYNVAQAPAVRQKELLMLTGARLSLRVLSSKDSEIDSSMIMGALLTFSEQDIDRIASIVLSGCVKSGTKEFVDEKTFQGHIHGYFLLMAEAIKVNLNPFFLWLVSARESQAGKENQKLE